jgi:transposase
MDPRTYRSPPKRTNLSARKRIAQVVERSAKQGDLQTWRRARAVLSCIEGRTGASIAKELGCDRSAVSRWFAAYVQKGIPALTPAKAPGPRTRLSDEQLSGLARIVEEGPLAAGFESGVWTARMITEVIRDRFDVAYSWKYVPELLHRLGFSVQRPRKRLARANLEAQERWIRVTFPAIKKKRAATGAS